jgi:hypothetical protein
MKQDEVAKDCILIGIIQYSKCFLLVSSAYIYIEVIMQQCGDINAIFDMPYAINLALQFHLIFLL